MEGSILKLSSKHLVNTSILIYLLYAFFADLIGVIFRAPIYRYSLWLFSIILIMIATRSFRGFKMKKSMFAIIMISLAFVIVRNQAFANHDYMTTVRWLYCFIFSIILIKRPDSYEKALNYIVRIGLIHVIATYIFFMVSTQYSSMFRIWGYWPSGTLSGRLGYKAALTNNYSRNGIMLAISYLAIFAIILSMSKMQKKKMYARKLNFLKIIFVLAVFATVLTTKRAHLVFGILAILIVYYFCNPEKVGNRAFKLIIIGIVGVIGLTIAAQYVPAISDLFERFTSIEEDSHLQSRFTFWMLALRMFIQSPIIGNGWFAFRYQYRLNLYDTSIRAARYELLDCHNVYIQLLAETGIIGLLFYLGIVIYILVITFRLIRNHRENLEKNNLYAPVIFSAMMQIFYLLYSITGNCLYDITSAFYFMSVAIAMGGYYRIKKQGWIVK